MTDKELRRLNRRELFEIIYQLKKNEQQLQTRLEQAEAKLQEREIRISQMGSIAEAALALNGVFEAAQRAADDYLNAVRQSHVQPEAPPTAAADPVEAADEDEEANQAP